MAKFENYFWKFNNRWITKSYYRNGEKRFVTYCVDNGFYRIYSRHLRPLPKDYKECLATQKEVHVDYRKGYPPRQTLNKSQE